MNKILLLLSLFFLNSCATNVKSSATYTGVDVDIDAANTDIKKNISIDTNSSIGGYGPDSSEANGYVNQGISKKSVGVFIGSAFYRTVLALDILKCFEINDEKINLITGSGIGALIATMYAQNGSPEEIRWKIINRVNEDKKSSYMSKDWTETWSDFIDKEINERDIVSSSISLWLPTVADGKVVYKPSRSVKEELNQNFTPTSRHYILNFDFYRDENLGELPVDTLVVIDTMPQKMSFKNPNEILISVYGKVFSFMKKELSDNKKIKILNIAQHFTQLDDINARMDLATLKPFCAQLSSFLD